MVFFKVCAQQASNSRRRGVQNSVHYSYTKSHFLYGLDRARRGFDAQTGNCRQKISVQTLDTCRRNLYTIFSYLVDRWGGKGGNSLPTSSTIDSSS